MYTRLGKVQWWRSLRFSVNMQFDLITEVALFVPVTFRISIICSNTWTSPHLFCSCSNLNQQTPARSSFTDRRKKWKRRRRERRSVLLRTSVGEGGAVSKWQTTSVSAAVQTIHTVYIHTCTVCTYMYRAVTPSIFLWFKSTVCAVVWTDQQGASVFIK